MNRYVADGILDDMTSGRTVLLVCEGVRAVRASLDELEARATHRDVDGLTIRRGNGVEGIQHSSGGRVVLVTARGHGGRGVSADVLFVDADLSLDRWLELRPSLVTSSHGEAMRR